MFLYHLAIFYDVILLRHKVTQFFPVYSVDGPFFTHDMAKYGKKKEYGISAILSIVWRYSGLFFLAAFFQSDLSHD